MTTTPSFDLSTFIDTLASGDPTPGGGSAAALAGALGASLAAMVARLTLGRPAYAEVEPEMQQMVAVAEQLRQQLIELVAQDAAAYEAVRTAYRLPKKSDAEQAARRAAIQEALKEASRTPLATADCCRAVLQLTARAAAAGNRNAATDACVGALLAHAGLQGAALNVRVNLTDLHDTVFVTRCEAAIAEHLARGQQLLQETLQAAGHTV